MQNTDAPDRTATPPPPPRPPARDGGPRRLVRDIYTPGQLDAVLRRERARSDRNACGFAAICFSIQRRDVTQKDHWRLAKILLDLLRETDEIGWFDERTLCAILPDTAVEGARVFAARAAAATRGTLHAPTHSIYVYPDHAHQPPRRPAAFGHRLDSATAAAGLIARLTAEIDRETPAPAPIAPADRGRPIAPLLVDPLPRWKRVLDVAVSAVAIVMTAPLWIAAIGAIKLSSPGPVFFKQQRTGLGGKPFSIWKFRTMCVDAERKQQALRALSEQDGPAFKLKNDPRIFKAGQFLRKTSIDELPQLINVLRGEMTLVGPRPLPVHEADACIGWQQRRHDVTPGLTCIWQVEGRSRVKFDEWMRMDRRYARRRSLVGDVLLVLKTIPAVLLRRGAN